MLFNSVEFLLFFPTVTLSYFLLPHRFRWILLLAASCIFYMAFIPSYILFLFFLILVDYTAGIWMEQTEGNHKKAIFFASLFCNLGLLFVFKYYNFFTENIVGLGSLLGFKLSLPLLEWVLPIGLSFHTFQSMAYTIEVYRGNYKAERHLGYYALYVMFYPQLVAGPIERPGNLLPQLHQNHNFDTKRVTNGLRLMLWGFFKKMAVADKLGILVNQVYNDPDGHSGIAMLLATYFFTIQVYCDFSGYSDIAIGAARVMGYELAPNFDKPYLAKSISEFWQRWHISLTSWFRDYIYLPLALAASSAEKSFLQLRISIYLCAVFLISGLWHGANWTFLVWGAIHGLYLVLDRFKNEAFRKWEFLDIFRNSPKLKDSIGRFTTFNLVAFSFIFFRARSLADAKYILSQLLTDLNIFHFIRNLKHMGQGQAILGKPLGLNKNEFLIAGLCIFAVFFFERLQRESDTAETISTWKPWVRWTCYYALLAGIIFVGNFDYQEFIYFQF